MPWGPHLGRRPQRTLIIGPAARYQVTASVYSPAAGSDIVVTAQLTDASNHAVKTAGVVITWSESGSGGSFSSPTSTTDANGRATVTFTTSTVPGASTTVIATDGASRTGESPVILTASEAGAPGNYFGSAYFSPDYVGAFDP